MTEAAHIEPYTLRLTMEGSLSDPMGITASLLTNLAQRCHEAGASMIGHIKCHSRTTAGNFHCSLTSLHSGAQCSPLSSLSQTSVRRIDLDLAVLVFGLEHETLDNLTRATIDALARTESATWAIACSSADHRHPEHSLGPVEPA